MTYEPPPESGPPGESASRFGGAPPPGPGPYGAGQYASGQYGAGQYGAMPPYGAAYETGRTVPGPVHVSSVLLFIAGGFSILGGVLILAVISGATGALVFAGILSLILGIFEVYVGIELRRLKPWARMATMIIAGINIALQLMSLLAGNVVSIVGLILNGVVLYFMFRPETVAAFSRARR